MRNKVHCSKDVQRFLKSQEAFCVNCEQLNEVSFLFWLFLLVQKPNLQRNHHISAHSNTLILYHIFKTSTVKSLAKCNSLSVGLSHNFVYNYNKLSFKYRSSMYLRRFGE